MYNFSNHNLKRIILFKGECLVLVKKFKTPQFKHKI